jgi:hypothetical protein
LATKGGAAGAVLRMRRHGHGFNEGWGADTGR